MNRRRYRPSCASDNITLIPASQLPFKDEWSKIAERLPAREALLVMPEADMPLKRVARALVPHLRAHGRHVTAAVRN